MVVVKIPSLVRAKVLGLPRGVAALRGAGADIIKEVVHSSLLVQAPLIFLTEELSS